MIDYYYFIKEAFRGFENFYLHKFNSKHFVSLYKLTILNLKVIDLSTCKALT
jgi:hypothetical protein